MIEAAHYTGQGLIVGLKSMMRPVANAADDMGGGVIDAMKDSLSRVSDVLDSDMDMAPTIRPVIDMSDVEDGLNSTFSKQQHLNMVNSIRSATCKSNSDGDGTNNNVVNPRLIADIGEPDAYRYKRNFTVHAVTREERIFKKYQEDCPELQRRLYCWLVSS